MDDQEAINLVEELNTKAVQKSDEPAPFTFVSDGTSWAILFFDHMLIDSDNTPQDDQTRENVIFEYNKILSQLNAAKITE